ncbi:MAG: ABC transporter permease [Oceanidesulfovibrio sp.]
MSFILDGFTNALDLLVAGDPETYAAIRATLTVSTMSMASTLCLGIPLGFLLGYTRFPGRRAAKTAVDTLLSLPTVVIGLLVYALVTRRGPLGDLELLFTLPGVALGQVVLGLPIVVAFTATAVESMDPRLRPTLLTLGANPRQILMTTLWEARYSCLVAAVTAYGRIVSEIGISMMIGGNIKWHTRTITTAIALETRKGQFSMSIALGLVLMAIALLVNLAVVGLRRKAVR